MIRKILIVFLIVNCQLSTVNCPAQDQHLLDSLQTGLKTTGQDTARADILYNLAKAFYYSNSDTVMEYAKQTLLLSEKIGYKLGISNAYFSMSVAKDIKGDYTGAIEWCKKSLQLRIELDFKKGIGGCYNNIGLYYAEQGNYPEALKDYLEALKMFELTGWKLGEGIVESNIATTYNSLENYTEALKHFHVSSKIMEELGDKNGIAGNYEHIGQIYLIQNNLEEAKKNYSISLHSFEELGNKSGAATCYLNLARISKTEGDYESALKDVMLSLKNSENVGDKQSMSTCYLFIADICMHQNKYNKAREYLTQALSNANEMKSPELLKDVYQSLSELDSAQGNFKQAYENYKRSIIFRDSVFNNENTKKITQQQMQFDFDKKQVSDSLQYVQEKELSTINLQRQKAITYVGFAGVVITLLFLLFIYRSFNNQKKANLIIAQNNEELNQVNLNLKETQSQLVQQEKLASLGALTAGIAHEIKNPLNFVNNFAELSHELLDELKVATSEEEKNELIQTLQQNLEKINHHGKRADSIVKSMLEHSRSGTGEKQPTDINRLSEEFLNLAYQGMRASVKDFNCTLEKHFEPNLPKLNIVPQDISRVILNLINNAFYAIKDKPGAVLSMSTKANNGSVIISIKDNGTGMTEAVKQKIFEPFYTTKPSGSGTGLGLSLSFDIIKAHGGKIEVNSEEGVGTEFRITLPANS